MKNKDDAKGGSQLDADIKSRLDSENQQVTKLNHEKRSWSSIIQIAVGIFFAIMILASVIFPLLKIW